MSEPLITLAAIAGAFALAFLDRWVRENTTQRFGPVREVAPGLVLEVAFDGLQKSPRHKSGFALRFPRIVRWRRDKRPEEIDTLSRVQELLRLSLGAWHPGKV